MNVQCEGWWEQDGFGRQPMLDLQLKFTAEEITGTGTDLIGDFEFRGSIKGTAIQLTKQYIGAHAVDYIGLWDGEGTYQGTWNISGYMGRWLIKVVRAESGTPIVEL